MTLVILNLLYSGSPLTGTVANSEVPDEMPQNVAFHQSLHFCLGQNNYIVVGIWSTSV